MRTPARAELLGYFTSGAISGGLSVFPGVGWIAGGAITGMMNAWLSGASGSEILQQGGVGAVSGLVGGAFGTLGGKVGDLLFKKVANSTLRTILGGMTAGALGGFGGGAAAGSAMGGDWLMSGLQGALLGAGIGGAVSGGMKVLMDAKPKGGGNKLSIPQQEIEHLRETKKLIEAHNKNRENLTLLTDDNAGTANGGNINTTTTTEGKQPGTFKLGGAEWWKLNSKGTFMRRDTTKPGQFAVEGIEYDNPASTNFPAEIKTKIDALGAKYGCHTCGTKDPGTKSKHFIPDHHPPVSTGATKFTLYPQCNTCSHSQGGTMKVIKSKK